jgi:hypothetical protein
MELFSYLTYSNYGNVRQRSAYSVGLLFVSSLIHNLHNDYIS